MTDATLPTHSRFRNLTNLVFGRLTVISYEPIQSKAKGLSHWNCRCSCGTDCVVKFDNLIRGKTTSCGCFHHQRQVEVKLTHGHTSGQMSPEYGAWRHMKGRCYDRNDVRYEEYGGRGISVFSGWIDDFPAFLAYVGNRPSPSHSLDRFPDQNGNYEPGNIRWSTPKEQSRNTRRNRILKWQGKAQCLSAWAEEIGIPASTLLARLDKHGWTVERAITEPLKQLKPRRKKLES